MTHRGKDKLPRKPWKEDDARMAEMLAAGRSYREIGEALGRTERACVVRAAKIGIKATEEGRRANMAKGAKEAAARPERRAFLIEQCRRIGQSEDSRARGRERGKMLARVYFSDPEVRARNAKAVSEANKRRSAEKMAWLPAAKHKRYASLRTMYGAEEARVRIMAEIAADKAAEAARLAKLSPFERQLEMVRRGAKIMSRPTFVANDYHRSLIGSALA